MGGRLSWALGVTRFRNGTVGPLPRGGEARQGITSYFVSVLQKLSTRCRKGNKFIRRVLAQAAWAASHTKRSYLCALFARLKLRRGWSRAIFAVAHKILIFAFKVLETGEPYQDLGNDFFDQLNPARATRKLLNRLERLGWQVQLSPSAPEV